MPRPIGINLSKQGDKMKLIGMIKVQTKHFRRSFTMITIPKLSKQMEQLLGPVADRLGKESGFVKRERIFRGSSFARTLVFSWWQDPAATCAARTETAHLLGCAVTTPAIEKRFSPQAADFLHRLLLATVRTAVEADPVNIPVLRRF